MFSPIKPFFPLPDVRGVLAIEFVVFRLDCVCLLGLRCGAGVKSSPSSSSILTVLRSSSSSSDDSTTTLRRVAARLDGLVGDSIFAVVFVYGGVRLFTLDNVDL